ncbi:MAG: 50S ribosomal protein L11 [Candidatus Pacebacteria bacterium]|nr:50S ribosomal protein L11 [Candidatus Paceibacterota bacterium]MDD2757059.1 50S ribosomal protein L11 [Candidatus Paceibacterota bacterium]MDD3283882.1 50S ribosomal protein L11 [Candidatus Paceibacterota bacterium]MDD3969846.1 50S ribosomal protein L11 [Candidatus Paceibacterota bacterium]MDD4737742.1 50S ribosomal protein L11 [Candidatus Paceibacterota bacterium]
MAKKVKAIIKLQIKAGKATPAPPVGPALAPHGLNIAEVCQKFNDLTKDKGNFKIPVEITVYEDRSFSMLTKQPPAAELIKAAIGLEKGSGKPNTKKVGKITRDQLREVLKQKMPDLNTKDEGQALRTLEGTSRSLGIEVID